MNHKSMLSTSARYNILRIRSKISNMAYERNMTILELFLRTIKREYMQLVNVGDITHYNKDPDYERVLGEKMIKIMKGNSKRIFRLLFNS